MWHWNQENIKRLYKQDMYVAKYLSHSVLSIGITSITLQLVSQKVSSYILPNTTTTNNIVENRNKQKTFLPFSSQRNSFTSTKMTKIEIDPEYPGTAVARLKAVHERVAQLTSSDLNGTWKHVRQKLLWAGGLKDLPDAVPGMGYTGHSFNDYNHVDLTTMNGETVFNTNDGSVKQIAVGNNLGPGIQIASIKELGPGGSWSTCSNGCHTDPPNDVAHVQFSSRIAFKLVWVPNENYDTFVLVDDDGNFLCKGTPSDGPQNLPSLRDRQLNFRTVQGSKYAVVAESMERLEYISME